MITKEDFKRAFDSAQPIAGDTSKLLDCIETIIKERDIANKRIRKLEKALKDIHYHQTMVGGNLSELSVTRKIAAEALSESGEK